MIIHHTINVSNIYEGRFRSSWTGGSAPLLCRGRRWLLCQIV